MPSPTRVLICCSVIALAACGSANASGGTAPTSTPSPSGRGFGAGTAGQLVQVNGTKLTLSTTSGDVTVVYTPSTTITSTSTGSTGDIVAGSCVIIVGQKDATGAVTATSVRLSQAVNSACPAAGRLGGGGAGGAPPARSFSPRPGTPTLNPNTTFVAGLVTAVTGTTVTVKSASGTTSSVTVPTTLSVVESSAATASDLVVDSCVRAVGPKNSQGIVQARALTIQPTDASGSCTFGRGGFGGFGGGFGGGGFGGGGFGGGGAPTSAA